MIIETTFPNMKGITVRNWKIKVKCAGNYFISCIKFGQLNCSGF